MHIYERKPTKGAVKTADVHAAKLNGHSSWYQKLNTKLAVKISKSVGSMTCAYIFACIALISLPAALATHNLIVIVSWVAQTFLQLVLLSVIMVGQDVGAQAGEMRSEQTESNTEAILHTGEHIVSQGDTAIAQNEKMIAQNEAILAQNELLLAKVSGNASA